MFVFSVKTSYRQVIAVLGCVAVIAAAILLGALFPSPTAEIANARVTDSAQRIAYLNAQGYEVVEDSEEVREVRIPDELDETLVQYNAVQEQTGRSLLPYRGKRVRLYTYQVTDGGEPIAASLYVYRDTLIAGDVAGKALAS